MAPIAGPRHAAAVDVAADERQRDTLQAVLEAAGLAVWELDVATRRASGSGTLHRLLGYETPPAQWTMAAFARHVFPDDLPAFRAALERCLTSGSMQCEARVLRHDGRIVWIAMLARATLDARGKPQRLVGVVQDISDRHAGSEFLLDSQAQLQSMFEVGNVGLAQMDALTGRVLRANSRLASMLGYSVEQLIGRHYTTLTHPADRAEHAAGVLQLLRGDIASYDSEMQLLRRGGGVVWALLTVHLLRDASGAPQRITAVIMDITERKRAEQALLEREEELRIARDELERRVDERTAELAAAVDALHREIAERGLAERQVRELLGRHVQAIEDERGRISRELHDTLGQHLAALAIGLKMIGDQPAGPDALREPVGRLRQVVERLDNEIDRLSYELRPPALDALGLEEALRSYAITWGNDGGVAVEVHTHGLHTGRLPAAVETTVYRVAQEALTNVRKHAGARRVGVILERRLDELRLVVEDDGCGFEPAATGPEAGRRWGLRSMAERAALVAGTLEIESSPGAGTTVYMAIPVNAGTAESWQKGDGVDAGADEDG